MINDTAQLLEKAADYIEQHGWTRGSFEKETGEVCASRAINRAVWADSTLLSQAEYDSLHDRAVACYMALGPHLGLNTLIGWNDTVCKDADEAVLLFRQTAKDILSNDQ